MFNIFKLSQTLLVASRLTIAKRDYSCNMKKALVFLAQGNEEMEAVISIDVLRRAGVQVSVCSLNATSPVCGAHQIPIVPDICITEAACKGPYDAIVLPGGMGGSKALADSKEVGDLLRKQECEGRIIAAICAAPTALKKHCVGMGKKLTSYPGVADQLQCDYCYQCDDVVVDGCLTTSRGPGTAFKFALSLVEQLVGQEKSCKLIKEMLIS